MIQKLKNKKTALLVVTSFLLVSLCLLPCGRFSVSDANASSHHGSHSMADQEMSSDEGHMSCHDGMGGSMTVSEADNHASCIHCDTVAPATLNKLRTLDLPDHSIEFDSFSAISPLLLTKGNLQKTEYPPPRFKDHIHKTISVYII